MRQKLEAEYQDNKSKLMKSVDALRKITAVRITENKKLLKGVKEIEESEIAANKVIKGAVIIVVTTMLQELLQKIVLHYKKK